MTRVRRLPFLAIATLSLLAFPALAVEQPSASAASESSTGASPAATAAAAPAAVSARPSGRQLGGHTFMPALGMVGPFTVTSFGTFLTMGAGSTQGSVSLQLPGSSSPQTFSGKVSYAAIGGLIGYEYAFLDNFSARVLVSETLYTGTTGAAAAVVGTNARIGGAFGLTGGVTLGDSLRVSGVFDASYAPRLGLLLGPAVRSAFDSCSMGVTECRFDFGQLFEQENVLTLTPGVAAGWAPLNALGVTGNMSFVYYSVDTSGDTVVTSEALSMGAALDFDFQEVSPVAVGLQVTWNSQFALASAADASSFTDLGGGLFYTGREDLALGVQVVNRRFRVVPEVDVSWSTLVGLMGLRYYWQ